MGACNTRGEVADFSWLPDCNSRGVLPGLPLPEVIESADLGDSESTGSHLSPRSVSSCSSSEAAFRVGARVISVVDILYGKRMLPANFQGSVIAVTPSLLVEWDMFEDLNRAEVLPYQIVQISQAEFAVGDRVTTLVDIRYGGRIVPANFQGTVVEVTPSLLIHWDMFEDLNRAEVLPHQIVQTSQALAHVAQRYIALQQQRAIQEQIAAHHQQQLAAYQQFAQASGFPVGGNHATTVQLVSLGSNCSAKMAFDALGRGQETLPFDWMVTSIESIIHFMRNNFAGFFDFNNAEPGHCNGTNFTVFRSATHSWWHDDPRDPAVREKFMRRIRRFQEMQAVGNPTLFVRHAATTDELPLVGLLMKTVLQSFGEDSKLLFVISAQDSSAQGPYIVDGIPNLLVYLDVMAAPTLGDAISAAMLWFDELEELPKCRRLRSCTAIPGLQPAHHGMFGMGGLEAFDDIPPHIQRPPRADGKPYTPKQQFARPNQLRQQLLAEAQGAHLLNGPPQGAYSQASPRNLLAFNSYR